MKEVELGERKCPHCRTSMEAGFFVYVMESEVFDRWFQSMDLVTKYCDRCFRETPSVTLFIEYVCPACGGYAGVYMECTPYSNAHFLTEITAHSHK